MIARGEADTIGVSPHQGFRGNTLDFLQSADARLKGVVLAYAQDYPLDVLATLPHLRFLAISGSQDKLNLSNFPLLEELRLEWNSKFHFPDKFTSLRSLYLRGYAPQTKNLSALPECPHLSRLEMTGGNTKELSGIEVFRRLSEILFSHMRALESIAKIASVPIETIALETCKKISDISAVRFCGHLKVLRLLDCGVLPSIDFIRECVALEEFRFVKTVVADGDLTPLVGLKRVGFIDRKGYSHRFEDFAH